MLSAVSSQFFDLQLSKLMEYARYKKLYKYFDINMVEYEDSQIFVKSYLLKYLKNESQHMH